MTIELTPEELKIVRNVVEKAVWANEDTMRGPLFSSFTPQGQERMKQSTASAKSILAKLEAQTIAA